MSAPETLTLPSILQRDNKGYAVSIALCFEVKHLILCFCTTTRLAPTRRRFSLLAAECLSASTSPTRISACHTRSNSPPTESCGSSRLCQLAGRRNKQRSAFEPAPEFNRPSGYGQHGFGPDWGLLGFAQLHLGGGLVDGVAEIKMRPQASGGARYRQRHLLPLFWVRGKPSSAKVLIN